MSRRITARCPTLQHYDFFAVFFTAAAFTTFVPCGRELPYERLERLPFAVRLSPLPMVMLLY
jgi:hypothetical protein